MRRTHLLPWRLRTGIATLHQANIINRVRIVRTKRRSIYSFIRFNRSKCVRDSLEYPVGIGSVLPDRAACYPEVGKRGFKLTRQRVSS